MLERRIHPLNPAPKPLPGERRRKTEGWLLIRDPNWFWKSHASVDLWNNLTKKTVAKVFKPLLGAPLDFFRVIAILSDMIVNDCACGNPRILRGLGFAAFEKFLVLTPLVKGHICLKLESAHMHKARPIFLSIMNLGCCVCVCDDISLSRKGFVYIQDVQLMQPVVEPSRVPPTQQARVFPGSQSNGGLEGFMGTSGLVWGPCLKEESPGWRMFGGACVGASGGCISDCASWNGCSAPIPDSSKPGKTISNESSGLSCAIGLGTALDMMTVRSTKNFCIVGVGINDMLATGKIS